MSNKRSAWPDPPRERQAPQVVIRDFAGYLPADDPHKIPPGAAIAQVNAASFRPGELRVRKGASLVLFED
jgi:hypothetical protein